jgi:hypothetical protein
MRVLAVRATRTFTVWFVRNAGSAIPVGADFAAMRVLAVRATWAFTVWFVRNASSAIPVCADFAAIRVLAVRATLTFTVRLVGDAARVFPMRSLRADAGHALAITPHGADLAALTMGQILTTMATA